MDGYENWIKAKKQNIGVGDELAMRRQKYRKKRQSPERNRKRRIASEAKTKKYRAICNEDKRDEELYRI